MDVQGFCYWIQERENIRVLKEACAPKPWTHDPIFQQFSFCNVRREDDKVTKWIKNNWRSAPRNDQEALDTLPFAMCVARHINWPETLEAIGYPFVWHPEKIRAIMKRRRDQGHKIYTGAYLVSTNGVSMDKIDYSIDRVLTPVFNGIRKAKKGETLESYWKHLLQFDGFGSFLAAQVVADLKHTRVLDDAPDWMSWAALGPGSIRGLHRFHGRDHTKSLSQKQGLAELLEAQKIVQDTLGMHLNLQDIQNCFCEYDKYQRTKLNQGRPRATYPGV